MAASRSTPAVVVDSVAKTFRIPHERTSTLKERAVHPLRRATFDHLEALKDVCFTVERGEFFGIVGRNGSGKSTLLKCLAGIYGVDRGAIYLDGRVSTFIELGVGFNAELPARDNVILNGIMLGLTPREAEARFHRVVEFANLEDFVDLKLKNYSSGMHVRLAFSMMIQVDADVLLIDEVLAVGDAAFQQKCFDVFNSLRGEKTILFVTHDMPTVQRFCHRALVLERGEIELIGAPDRVASHYFELNFHRERSDLADQLTGERFGDQSVEIVDSWFEHEHGERADALSQGQVSTYRMRVIFRRRVEDPILAVVFENERQLPLLATSSDWVKEKTGTFEAGEEATLSVSFETVFAPGRIFATPRVIQRDGLEPLDHRPQMLTALVRGPYVTGGLVDIGHEVTLERGGDSVTARTWERAATG